MRRLTTLNDIIILPVVPSQTLGRGSSLAVRLHVRSPVWVVIFSLRVALLIASTALRPISLLHTSFQLVFGLFSGMSVISALDRGNI